MSTKIYLFLFSLLTIITSCGKVEGLKIEEDAEIKIVQRGSKTIKGSEGDVELKINDITGGSTEVMIEGIDNGKMYLKKYLGVGEDAIFQYEKYYYRIKINQFENHTFHDDFAFISFRAVSEEKGKADAEVVTTEKDKNITPDEIREYLDRVKNSRLQFMRNGETLTDTTMAALLENKYMINLQDIKSEADFIKKVIDHSSLTGETYKVITKKNDTLSLVKWLNI